MDHGADIYSDITFFAAAGAGSRIWENVKARTGKMDFKIIYIDHERNPVDAAADGGIFRTVLSVWNAYFYRIPYDGGVDRVCD